MGIRDHVKPGALIGSVFGQGAFDWGLDDLNASTLVDIEGSPGLENFPLTLALFALTKAMIFFYLSRVLSTSIVHVRVEVLLVQHENAAYLALFFGYGFRCGTMARVSESNQMLSVGIIAVRAFWMFLMAAVLATLESAEPLGQVGNWCSRCIGHMEKPL